MLSAQMNACQEVCEEAIQLLIWYKPPIKMKSLLFVVLSNADALQDMNIHKLAATLKEGSVLTFSSPTKSCIIALSTKASDRA